MSEFLLLIATLATVLGASSEARPAQGRDLIDHSLQQHYRLLAEGAPLGRVYAERNKVFFSQPVAYAEIANPGSTYLTLADGRSFTPDNGHPEVQRARRLLTPLPPASPTLAA